MLTDQQIKYLRQTALALFEAPDEGADMGNTFKRQDCGAIACACGWWALRFGVEYGFHLDGSGNHLRRDDRPADFSTVYQDVFNMDEGMGLGLFGYVTQSGYDLDILGNDGFAQIQFGRAPNPGPMHKRIFFARVLAFCKEHNIDPARILTPEMTA